MRTWHEERGAGEPLVLLHPGGAGVDSRAFGPNIDAMAERFRSSTPRKCRLGFERLCRGPYAGTPETSGTGGNQLVDGPPVLLRNLKWGPVRLVQLHGPPAVFMRPAQHVCDALQVELALA